MCAECSAGFELKLRQEPLLDLKLRYACTDYQGPVKAMLSRAKDEAYCSQYFALSSAFVAAVTPLLADLLKDGKVVVCCVPSSRQRRLRGWYLPEAIARNVAQNTGIRFRPLLRRKRNVAKQSSLDAVQRRMNLHQCFASRKLWRRQNTRDTAVLIIDDVSTSGASLVEAARCLGLMNFRQVIAISLAIAPLRC